MIRAFRPDSSRRGAVAVLFVFLLIPLLGILALAIDAAWIAQTKTELQNAADAAALAGAQKLMSGYVMYNMPRQNNQATILSTAEADATASVRQIANHNAAGGVKSLVLNDADVEFGFTDAQGGYQPISQKGGYPNTVTVVLRRDSGANTPLTLFFSRIFGINSTEITASAAATTYAGVVTSFNPGAGVRGLLLPVAFDINAWNSFLVDGKSPDGQIHAGPNGCPQMQVYPSPTNCPGNFGLVCIGPKTNSASDYNYWVVNGPSPADIQYLVDNQMLPVSLSGPEDWDGSPGLKSNLSDAFGDLAISGVPKLLPLFRPVSTNPYQAASGQGSNSEYDIVGFAGVVISAGGGHGGSLELSVQPCAVIDATAVFQVGSVAPTGTTTSLITTLVPPRLSK
jgi:Flp pilus assembly protein TadG